KYGKYLYRYYVITCHLNRQMVCSGWKRFGSLYSGPSSMEERDMSGAGPVVRRVVVLVAASVLPVVAVVPAGAVSGSGAGHGALPAKARLAASAARPRAAHVVRSVRGSGSDAVASLPASRSASSGMDSGPRRSSTPRA